MKELIDSVVKEVTLDTDVSSDRYVYFSQEGYKPIPFDRKHFSKIQKTDSSSKKMLFVDGGNCEIIRSANISLQLVRLYYCVYQNKKKIHSAKKDFYVYVKANRTTSDLFYETKLFGCDFLYEEDFKIDSNDETITSKAARGSVSQIGTIVRRCAEIAFAKKALSSLSFGDIVVLDGSLQCTYAAEENYVEDLCKVCVRNGIVLIGISKTTQLMTDKGNSVVSKLLSYGVSDAWLYYPVVEMENALHPAEISFAKFHSKSKYVFKFEIFKDQKEQLSEVALNLCTLSSDSVFLGYPYGLIDADRNARVGNTEKNMLMMYFRSRFGADWDKIEQAELSLNAHSVLDSIG